MEELFNQISCGIFLENLRVEISHFAVIMKNKNPYEIRIVWFLLLVISQCYFHWLWLCRCKRKVFHTPLVTSMVKICFIPFVTDWIIDKSDFPRMHCRYSDAHPCSIHEWCTFILRGRMWNIASYLIWIRSFNVDIAKKNFVMLIDWI